jgi:hypothetical protein
MFASAGGCLQKRKSNHINWLITMSTTIHLENIQGIPWVLFGRAFTYTLEHARMRPPAQAAVSVKFPVIRTFIGF